MYNKICKTTCSGCQFSGINEEMIAKTLTVKKAPIAFDIDYYENYNKVRMMNLSDLPNNIVLKKNSHKPIVFDSISKTDVVRIVYHILYEDLLNKNTLQEIKNVINSIIVSGIFIRIYVIVENKSDIINTFKILNEYKGCSINFYSNKYWNFDKYPEVKFHAIDKVKISDLCISDFCDHPLIKNSTDLYDYKG